jgi:hypothetical protein
MSAPRHVPVVLAAIGVLLAGCSSHSKDNVPTPTLLSPAPQTSVAVTSPAPASSSAMPEAILPRACTQLLPLATVQQALGVALQGDVHYLRAAAVPQSGRTGRVTCDYGIPAPTAGAGVSASPAPDARGLVEASYITYVDAKTAESRMHLTVQTDGQTSSISNVTVGGKPGFVLLGKEWNELVMADGARTIVVEAAPSVLPAAKAPAALAAMASVMLRFDAEHYSGAISPAASPAVSPS